MPDKELQFDESTDDFPKRPKRRRRRYVALIGAIGILVVLWFLPTIICQTPLKQTMVDWALSDLNGKVRIDTVSAGWFRPIEATGIVVRDPQGETIAEIDRLVTSSRLIDLLGGRIPEQIEIRQPVLKVEIQAEQTNIERLIEKYLNQPGDDSSLPAVSIVVTEGRVEIRDGGQRQWTFSDFNARTDLATGDAAFQLQLSSQVQGYGEPDGRLELAVEADPGQSQLAFQQINVAVKANEVPIDWIGPIVARWLGPNQIAGQVTTQLVARCDLARNELAVEVDQFDCEQPRFGCENLLGTDLIQAARLVAHGELAVGRQRFTATRFQAETDFGKLTVDGEFDLERLAELAGSGQLPEEPFSIQGQFDLARLLQMMPGRLAVRQDVVVQSGLLNVRANTQNQGNVKRILVDIETSQLTAMRGGQPIVWRQPVRCVGVLSENNGRLELDRISVESDFLNLVGRANLDAGNVSVDGDFALLKQRLGQFIDLDSVSLTGKFQGQTAWQRRGAPSRAVNITGDFDGDRLAIDLPGGRQWREPTARVAWDFDAEYRMQPQWNAAILEGSAQIRLGNDLANVQIVEPVDLQASTDHIRLGCQVAGDIERWVQRGKNWVEIPDLGLGGQADATFLMDWTPDRLQLVRLKAEATGFRMQCPPLRVDEPRVVADGNLAINLNDGRMRLVNFNIATATLAASSAETLLAVSPKIVADGNVAFQLNIDRVARWFGFNQPADAYQYRGMANGQINLASATQSLGGQLAATIQNLVIVDATSSQPLWTEPEAQLGGNIFLGDDWDSIRAGGVDLTSRLARVQGRAVVTGLSGQWDVRGTGRWQPDWPAFNQWMNPDPQQPVLQIAGAKWHDWVVDGPLFPTDQMGDAWVHTDLTAQTSVGWQEMMLWKIPVRQHEIQLQLQGARVALGNAAPSQKPDLVEELLAAGPVVDLSVANPMLLLPPGPLLDDLQMSEQSSRELMKYVAPILADVTAAEGEMTVVTEGVRVPLFDPMAVRVRGRVELARAAVGPGALTRNLIQLLDPLLTQIKPGFQSIGQRDLWLRLEPQSIPFAVQDGRVYHERLVFQYQDVALVTSGSVGFDQSLDLNVQLPVQDSWIQGKAWLAGLRGQSLGIPITGSLTRPRVDQRGVRELTQQVLRTAAQSAVGNVINDQLNQGMQKLNNRVGSELDRLRGRAQETLQDEIGDRLKENLNEGLNRLFRRDKDPGPTGPGG